MRILQLHVDYIEYKPIEKEIEMAEESDKEKKRYEDVVVVFTAAEKGDDSAVAKKAMKEVKDSLDIIKCKEVIVYPFAHLSSNLLNPYKAVKVVKVMESEGKRLGLKVYRAPFGWNKQFELRIKGHPLAEQAKTITSEGVKKEEEELISKALKEEEKIKSHWHVMKPDGKLIPIKMENKKLVAGGDFEFKKYKNLEKFAKYEIAKSREVKVAPPHIKMMREMEIADYEDASDSGNLRFYPKGRLIKSLLEDFVTQKVIEYGGMEVETPLMYSVNHPAAVDYLNKFPARQYIIKSGDKEFFARFSACFGQFCMANNMTISYKNLPVWLYELTRYSFRRERKSELAGLRRLRAFTMPDVHAFCENIPQAIQEFKKRFKMCQETLEGIGFDREEYELAIRFTKEFYNDHKDLIHLLMELHGKPALIEIWDKRAFYFVLKYEFNIVDALDKCSALSTDQIDIENAKRYRIEYIDEEGKKNDVIILHCSPSGAIERDIYALLERAYLQEKSGETPEFPLWLSPTQVRLIPVSGDYVDFAEEVSVKFEKDNIRVDVDDRSLTVQKKVRDAELEWVPFILVVGEREKKGNEFTVRIRSKESEEVKMNFEQLVEKIQNQVQGKPFKKLSLPKLLSKRPIFVG